MKTRQKSQEKEAEIKKIYKWKIKVGMTVNFRYIGINLIRLIREVALKERMPFFVSSNKFSLEDNNKTAHLVGHSKLKTPGHKSFLN